jgi:hypothetical protein
MKNPYLNALSAAAYIALIASLITYAPKTDVPLGAIGPIMMLSLLVLSTALMGYFFAYEPVRLLIEGEKEKALRTFFQTVGSFAVITALVLGVLLVLGIGA